MCDSELHSAVVEVQRQMDRLCGVAAKLHRSWEERGIWASDGSRSAPCRLSRSTGMSVSTAKHVLFRARRLSSMPRCSSALLNGDLSVDRVDLLVKVNRP